MVTNGNMAQRKLRIILDVDGVVADFVGHLVATMTQLGLQLTYDDVTSWDAITQMGDRYRRLQDLILADPSWWLDLPLITGAMGGVDAIRSAGHEIVWCTTPWQPCDEWCSVRYKWLKKWFNAAVCDVIFCSRKELIHADAIVDDRPQNVAAWCRVAGAGGGRGLLVDRPWNRAHRLDTILAGRVNGWPEIVAGVRAIATGGNRP